MAFTLEALYAAAPKSEAELQADVDSPEGKEGAARALALLAAASAHRERQDGAQAAKTVKEALAIAKDRGAEDLEALVLCAQGKVLRENSLVALQCAMRALKLYKEIGDVKGQAAASFVAALVHEAKPNAADAAWKANEARKLFAQAGDKAGEAASLEVAARCSLAQQDFEKGVTAARDAVAALKALGFAEQEAASMVVLAKAHMGKGEFELALQVAKDAMAKFEDLGKPKGAALDIAMSTYLKMGSKDDAAFAAQQEVTRLEQIGDLKEQASVLRKLAEMQYEHGKPEQASGPAGDLAKLCKSVADPAGEAKALVLCAQIKASQRELPAAEKLIAEVLEITKTLGWAGLDTELDAVVLSCNVKASTRKWDVYFNYAIEQMNKYKGLGVAKGEGTMLVEIADKQPKANPNDQSFLNTLQAAVPLFTAANAQKELADCLVKIGRIQFTRNDSREGLKSAEQALAIYDKLSDQEGRAEASQLVATGYTRLGNKGNAMEAVRAAQAAVAIHQKNGDRESEANALNLLANAQLMNHSVLEAQRTARKAETIFKDVDDLDGQASALLLVAGAHLAASEFAEARDMAKEARQLFQDSNNGRGEDGADEFLDALKQYEAGAFNSKDFRGFTMSSGEAVERTAGSKAKAKEKKKDTSVLSNVDLFIAGNKGDKVTVTFFEAFEARRATAPTRGPAARRASEEAKGGEDEPVVKKPDPVLFCIRLMPQNPVGQEEIEKRPKYEPVELEDKRVHMALDLGQPNARMPGNVGKTDRLFSAMGDQQL